MDANDTSTGIYTFAGFTLDAGKRLVFDPQGEPVSLMPKAYEILFYLVTNSQRVIEKDELMAAIWPDTIVEENNLTQNISGVRRALGEKHRENRFIATVPGHGYKFVAEVAISNASSPVDSAGTRAAGENASPGSARRIWPVVIAALVLIGLITVAFVVWKERSKPSTSEIRSVAVLPFKPLTSDRDESLELGMADTLIMKLGSDDRVAVRPLSSVRRFSSLDQDPAEAGRAVGVDAVLEGNIQIASERIRVSVRLLRVSDARQLWSGQFDEKLTDIFQVQDSIAQRVANALNISLATGVGKKTFTASVEAYQLYLRGNLHARRLIRSEVEKGIVYYEEALKLDPNFALVYVGLSNAYRALVLTSDYRPADFMPKAKEAAAKAIELDNTLAEAWAARAFVMFWYDWDWRSAETDHLRALELDPYSSQSRLSYAHLLSNLGRHDEAIMQARMARERDPVGIMTNAVEGHVLMFAGQNEDAMRSLNGTIDMEPNFWLAHLFISRVHLRNGQFDLAIASARRAAELSGGNAEALGTVGFAFARSGRNDEARKILLELEERSKTRYVPSHSLAQIHAGLNERNAALDFLEKGFADRDANMVFLKIDSRWDDLRSEPRFVELMKRMNFK